MANFVERGVEFATKATQADREARKTGSQDAFEEAYRCYLRAVEYLLTAIRWEKSDKTKQLLQTRVREYIVRAEFLKEQLKRGEVDALNGANGHVDASHMLYADPQPEGGGNVAPSAAAAPNASRRAPLARRPASAPGGVPSHADEAERLREQLSSVIVREKPNVHWADVAGLEGAKDALREAVVLPIRFPHLFTGKREPWKGILLYGPPGTGKSFLAKAVATESDASFFSISSADLVSKWQGESEKLVRQLFIMARDAAPSIVFIDEVDALCSSRAEGEADSMRRIKTEFLIQMQEGVGQVRGEDGLAKHVLVLGATNLPWQLDSAIRRRFERRVYIPLPDAPARKRIFETHVGSTPNTLALSDYGRFAAQTEGYSGSDISIVVRDAIMQPVRRLQSATHFRRVRSHFAPVGDASNGSAAAAAASAASRSNGSVAPGKASGNTPPDWMWTPCSPGAPGAVEMSLLDVPPDRLLVPDVCAADFEEVLCTARPSVAKRDLDAYERFTQEYGQEGV
ncbi:hypothetical protein CDCA_CDCA09G2732 [Cyanidium caldarium]|uniref:Vesicle-fusing ATPase n=1 Tax=Cyanidium caldarium TaxID=2771 RepID=A0AAV9IWR4_CYACA|nr:hypothetical protein CDCA_CDCA09G2732 [Cyanidium caldarium]